jgi:hypothetical protein
MQANGTVGTDLIFEMLPHVRREERCADLVSAVDYGLDEQSRRMLAIEFRVLLDEIGRKYDRSIPVDLQSDTLRPVMGTGDHESISSFFGEAKLSSSRPQRGEIGQGTCASEDVAPDNRIR